MTYRGPVRRSFPVPVVSLTLALVACLAAGLAVVAGQPGSTAAEHRPEAVASPTA